MSGKANGLRAEAVHTTVLGMTGMHRAYASTTNQGLVRSARGESIKMFRESIVGNTARLRQFTERHSENELLSDPALETKARSILNIRARLETAVTALESGLSFVYAVEVVGFERDKLQALARDPRVRTIVGNDIGSRAGLKPAGAEVPWSDERVTALPRQQLYSALMSVVREDQR